MRSLPVSVLLCWAASLAPSLGVPIEQLLLTPADIGPGGCPSQTLRQCSSHGRCDGSTRRCLCDRGYSGAGCERAEFLLGCPHNCSFSTGGGVCGNGNRCICNHGRSGDDCADHTHVNCTLACAASGHGQCFAGQCRCFPGYYGPQCQQGCPGWSEDGLACSGRGICVSTGSPNHSPDVCKCHVGFAGSGCERDLDGVTLCPRHCSGHGSCLQGRCTCDPRFAGHDCSIELRQGQLAHALDGPLPRLVAFLVCAALSGLMAFAALRYINGPSKVSAAATGKGDLSMQGLR